MLELPVPKVLTWSADSSNPVGSEYIIMEEASGGQLSETWDSMELEDQAQIMEDLVEVDNKFLSASFHLSGALYFSESLSDRGHPAELRDNWPESLKHDVRSKFVIGPTVERLFWEKERAQMTIDRGPCTISSFLNEFLLSSCFRENR